MKFSRVVMFGSTGVKLSEDISKKVRCFDGMNGDEMAVMLEKGRRWLCLFFLPFIRGGQRYARYNDHQFGLEDSNAA